MSERFYIDGKRVGIVGSRNWGFYYDKEGNEQQDLSQVYEFVGSLPGDCIIVSGGARGVDTAAIDAAKMYGLDYKVWEAEWRKYGKQAGYIRNVLIVRDSDICIAFWNGYSKGTAHSIALAKERGIPCIIFKP